MRKLKLDLDDLRVDTFAAGERVAAIGTVRANAPYEIPSTDTCTAPDDSGGGSSDCTPRHTCAATCGIPECTAAICLTYDYCCP
jgi:hypothetical protein